MNEKNTETKTYTMDACVRPRVMRTQTRVEKREHSSKTSSNFREKKNKFNNREKKNS